MTDHFWHIEDTQVPRSLEIVPEVSSMIHTFSHTLSWLFFRLLSMCLVVYPLAWCTIHLWESTENILRKCLFLVNFYKEVTDIKNITEIYLFSSTVPPEKLFIHPPNPTPLKFHNPPALTQWCCGFCLVEERYFTFIRFYWPNHSWERLKHISLWNTAHKR